MSGLPVGARFGLLTVTGRASLLFWNVVCDCGKSKEVRGANLRNGSVKSCGCRQHDRSHTRTTYKWRNTLTYSAWQNMLNRCRNPNVPHYHRYGGRGISVCERWTKFDNFLADMGEAPPGMTIERQDNDGNYEPTNCVLATRKEQGVNRSATRRFTAFGVEKLLPEWIEDPRCVVSAATLNSRLCRGWKFEAAMTIPLQRGHAPRSVFREAT